MPPSEDTRECAVFLARGELLEMVWANEGYLSLLQPPYSEGDIAGMPLTAISPLGQVRQGILLQVMSTGEPQGGEDRVFSVENGTLLLRWHAYRPLPEHVLVVIQKEYLPSTAD